MKDDIRHCSAWLRLCRGILWTTITIIFENSYSKALYENDTEPTQMLVSVQPERWTRKTTPQTQVVWFACFSGTWNEQGLDLDMGRGSLVFLRRLSYRAESVMLAVWAPFAGFEGLQQACSSTLKHLRNDIHSLYKRPEADGPILGTVATIRKPSVAYTVVVSRTEHAILGVACSGTH